MIKIILLTLFISILGISTQCPNKESMEYKYTLGIGEIPDNNYVLSLDGKYFYYFDGNKLIKICLESQKRDSILLMYDSTTYGNLASRFGGVSILSFNKKNQYNANLEKQVYLVNYDSNLNILDTFVFNTPIKSRLLDEDFSYTSLFIDSLRKKIYFNDRFSQMTVAEKGTWSFETQRHTVVDPLTGVLYKASTINEKEKQFSIISPIDKIFLADASVLPSQFSVVNKKTVYYENKFIYYSNEHIVGKWDHVSTISFNPCRRYENGVYRLDKGTLLLNLLF